jgi:thiol-disulfide isomerase/thioredoxin
MAEKFLNDAGVPFVKVYADQSPDMAKEYGITAAPTLVVEGNEGYEKIMNVSNIRRFAENFKK